MSEWEKIANSYPGEDANCGQTFRLMVPGGWLVRVEMFEQPPLSGEKYRWKTHMEFVSDPEHFWEEEEDE